MKKSTRYIKKNSTIVGAKDKEEAESIVKDGTGAESKDLEIREIDIYKKGVIAIIDMEE